MNVLGEKNAFWSPWPLPQIVFPPAPGPPDLSTLPIPWSTTPPTSAPPSAPTGASPPPSAPTVTPPEKAPYVILYGAPLLSGTWCGACKQAEAHMKSRAIAYAYKDVDDDANAQELAAKVKAAGEKQGAIPVTDVEGDLLVGWSQQRFDEVFDAKA